MSIMDDDKAATLDEKLAALETETDGEVMEPIEVEIGADGAGTVIETATKDPVKDDDEPPAGKLPRRGKSQRTMDGRIGRLNAEKNEAELRAQRLHDELEQERAARKKAEEKATVADAAALANYEQ